MVSMRITERRVSNVTVVELDGPLILDEDGDIALREYVDRLLAQGHARIVLDLGRVSRLDSAGIGMLVSKYLSACRKGGVLKLMNLTPRATELMRLTKLSGVFEIFDSEADAIRSFTSVPSQT